MLKLSKVVVSRDVRFNEFITYLSKLKTSLLIITKLKAIIEFIA